jgi:hypothetical protein
MPYSGSSIGPRAPLRPDMRFLIAPYLIGILLFANLIENTKRRKPIEASVLLEIFAFLQ